MRHATVLLALACALVVAPAAGSATPVLHVSLTATTHDPHVNAPWTYTVRVTGFRGRRVDAVVSPRIVYKGKTVDTLGYYGFKGSLTRTYKWPSSTRGKSLEFVARVQALRRIVYVRYTVAVS